MWKYFDIELYDSYATYSKIAEIAKLTYDELAKAMGYGNYNHIMHDYLTNSRGDYWMIRKLNIFCKEYCLPIRIIQKGPRYRYDPFDEKR